MSSLKTPYETEIILSAQYPRWDWGIGQLSDFPKFTWLVNLLCCWKINPLWTLTFLLRANSWVPPVYLPYFRWEVFSDEQDWRHLWLHAQKDWVGFTFGCGPQGDPLRMKRYWLPKEPWEGHHRQREQEQRALAGTERRPGIRKQSSTRREVQNEVRETCMC